MEPRVWASNPQEKILSQEVAEKGNQRRALGPSEKRGRDKRWRMWPALPEGPQVYELT